MLCLRIKAPFAAFRTFTAGSYRPTAPFITPSAAYGLALNLAGIESRYDDGRSAMTLMRQDLPRMEIALGAVCLPEVQSIYQQLHNYPVGQTGNDRADSCKGAKYNIQPIRREYLSGIDGYVCIRGNDQLENQARRGLNRQARPDETLRYGIPFLGDNSYMVDIIEEESPPNEPAYWHLRLLRLEPGKETRYARLPVWIDRADQTGVMSHLYEIPLQPIVGPPEDNMAWTAAGPPPRPEIMVGQGAPKRRGKARKRT